jgi:hypothetical protein
MEATFRGATDIKHVINQQVLLPCEHLPEATLRFAKGACDSQSAAVD